MAGRPSTLQIRVTSDSTQAQEDIEQTQRKFAGTMDKLKQSGPALAAAAGAAIGAGLIAAFQEAMDQSRIKAKLGAQLGATPEEAKKYGELAGKLYTEGVTADFETAADTIRATFQNLNIGETAGQDMEKLAVKAADLATIMDEEVGATTRAVAQILKTGLAKNADEAFDVLTRGVQTGANAAGDLLDTFSEYSTQFRDLGLSAEEAMGLLTQGLQGGARDSDLVADALKELNIRVKDLTAEDALKQLGLDADAMADAFTEGGPKATRALDEILDRIRNVKDPTEQARLATQLFGTQFEDMSDALLKLDPTNAVDALGQVEGASDDVASSLRDNAGAELEKFKREALQGFVTLMEEKVIPIVRTLYRWFKEYIAPVFNAVWQIMKQYLLPVWEAFREGLAKVRDKLRENRVELRPVYEFLLKLAKVSGGAAAKGLGIMFDALVDIIDALAQLVGWLQTAYEWIRRVQYLSGYGLGRLIGGGLFSADTAMAPLAADDAPSLFAAAPAPYLAQSVGSASFSTPIQVYITIDGQQLQGRIDRTVVRGLNADGAMLRAGRAAY